MSDLVFLVQQIAAAGPDRSVVTLSQVNTGDGGAPFFGASLTLNLDQSTANTYEVNSRYALTLEPEVALISAPPAKADTTTV